MILSIINPLVWSSKPICCDIVKIDIGIELIEFNWTQIRLIALLMKDQ